MILEAEFQSRKNHFIFLVAGISFTIALSCYTLFAQDKDTQSKATDGRTALVHYLDAIANKDLEEREAAIAKIQTQAQAEARKTATRNTILHLIGGLPEKNGSLNAQQLGTITEDGFRIEKVVYDSLPGFHVTANLYLPEKTGTPFPAIIYTPGHGPAGKLEAYNFAANLARNGIAVLAYDPMGEGERLQYVDTATGKSLAGRATGEHSQAGVQDTFLGEHISRYFVNDAMRGIDYLISRPDIDANRIGALGCSGGGTVTAYLAALDDRVKVAAAACYITSFQKLLPTAGPQEAEQSIPGFLEAKLNFGDWVELAAPKPYAIISTTNDMFPFAGAQQTYEEARRIYSLYGATDHLQWIVGLGGHGNLKPITGPIVTFFTRWLLHSEQPANVVPLAPSNTEELLCTNTGQVATSLKGENISSILRERSKSLVAKQPAIHNRSEFSNFQKHLTEEVLSSLSIELKRTTPTVKVLTTTEKPTYQLQTLQLESEDGILLSGALVIPKQAGRKPATLLLDEGLPSSSELVDHLASSGQVVLALQPRPSPTGTEEQKSSLLGTYYLLSLRSMLIGKNLVGMRTQDALQAIHWLSSQKSVNAKAIEIRGIGPLGVVALHAAFLSPHVAQATVDKTLLSYRMIPEEPFHRNLSEVAIPGVLRHYDLEDLLLGITPRSVTVIDPIDAAGNSVAESSARRWMDTALQTAAQLGSSGSIHLQVHQQKATDTHPQQNPSSL